MEIDNSDKLVLEQNILDKCREFEHEKGLENSLDKKFTRHGIQVPEKFKFGEEVVIQIVDFDLKVVFA